VTERGRYATLRIVDNMESRVRSLRRPDDTERGAALVEVAMVLPLVGWSRTERCRGAAAIVRSRNGPPEACSGLRYSLMYRDSRRADWIVPTNHRLRAVTHFGGH
jgi:hypothetical protein